MNDQAVLSQMKILKASWKKVIWLQLISQDKLNNAEESKNLLISQLHFPLMQNLPQMVPAF